MEYLKTGVKFIQFIGNCTLAVYIYLMIKEYIKLKKDTENIKISLKNFSTYSIVMMLSQRELSDDDVLRLEHIIKVHNTH